jgi:tetratricopeptide (TPR) repeat protein
LISRRKEDLGEDIKQPFEAELVGKLGEGMSLDIFEQMKWQIDKLQEIADSDEEDDKQDSRHSDISKFATKYRGISGSHKTFASLSHDRFNEHMRAAEVYLKEGKYYRAADAYTMASVYKRGDPLAYAGKSHALFAAGEYMSSALFLSRALKVFPEYAQLKIDIVTMVGSRDKLESRIVDIEEILERVDVPELQFLLGYVYYQMDRLGKAKESIDAAYEEMSDSSAVIELRKAIYSK